MIKEIVGIEIDKPWTGRKGSALDGKSGVTSKLYLVDTEDDNFVNDNGHMFLGKTVETVKIPKTVDKNKFNLGDKVKVYYNRFGNVDDIVIA